MPTEDVFSLDALMPDSDAGLDAKLDAGSMQTRCLEAGAQGKLIGFGQGAAPAAPSPNPKSFQKHAQ